MSEKAIQVSGLSKRYLIGATSRRSQESLREWLAARARRGRHDARDVAIWALKDVSFEVVRGEVVGVIGRNGAGKSTLLKILSRITEPTSGRVVLNGRVGSLLEVGTGFHPELTGRENVYLSGAILGMTRQEIDRSFDEIVAFSGVEKFLDTPIKRYSSGMNVRLGFAVAAHLEPEILLVDEVLAVGDAAFQKKCLGKIGEVASGGRTVLFVSHNMSAVQALCHRGILLDQGRVVTSGDIHGVINSYLKMGRQLQRVRLEEREDRGGDGRLRLTSLETRTEEGAPTNSVQSGQNVQLAVSYRLAQGEVSRIKMAIVFLDNQGRFLFACNNEAAGSDLGAVRDDGTFVCQIEKLPLPPGTYQVNLQCSVGGQVADHVVDAGTIEVEPGDYFGSGYLPDSGRGGVFVMNQWRVEGTN